MVQINTYYGGSTGAIMRGIHTEAMKNGLDSYIFWGRGVKCWDAHEKRFSNNAEVYTHALLARLIGRRGFIGSDYSTRLLIREIKKIEPDIIHLHNTHGYVLNWPILFGFLNTYNRPVVWTLHDGSPFTGHCGYGIASVCTQWQQECGVEAPCPQIRTVCPSLFFDFSRKNFNQKKKLYGNLPGLNIVTPSRWLASLVGQSFLGGRPISVINNGIDTDIFKPTESDVRQRLGVRPEQHMLLGVASPWSGRKGLPDLIELSKSLDASYVVVAVGLSEQQLEQLPAGMIGIKKTDSAQELAAYYSAADLFVNPTYEDNYPTVNLEALACGTRVLTYDTGGSAECCGDRSICMVTDGKGAKYLEKKIVEYFSRPYTHPDVYVRSNSDCAADYVELYNAILNDAKERV